MSRAPAPHLETEILSAYLDGQLSAAERGRVESHLQGCADCARRLAGLRSAIASLQSLDRVEPPAELFAEVRRRAAQVAPESAGGPLAWIAWPARHPGFAGASLAVLATVVALVY
ncbi:MAG: anti-sigma factor family protein, partial [Acidobacteriota bacterium]